MSAALKKDKREPVRIQLKKNDQVKVIAGRDKGKTGRVLGVDSGKGRILVEHVNMVKRHTKKNPAKQIAGGIAEMEASIAVSNAMILCPKCGPVRIGHHVTEVGGKARRTRICRKCGQTLDKTSEQDWQEMIDTNVLGLLHVTRAIIPGMVERGRGHVINLGSVAGHMTYANGAVYCASKAAEKSISEGLKLDLMGTPVRVTSIDPGMVETDFSKVRFRGDEEKAAKVYQNITPLQPEDIADAIVWAVSRPAHVNIHTVVLTSIDQANSMVLNRRG